MPHYTQFSHPLLTPADAGRRIDRTPAAIRAAIKRGALAPVTRTSGGMALLSPEAVDAYAARCAARRV
jgi:hypothetical protein